MGYEIYFARTEKISKDANKAGDINLDDNHTVFVRDFFDWDSTLQGEPVAISFNYKEDLNKLFDTKDWIKLLSNKKPGEILNIIELAKSKNNFNLLNEPDISRFTTALTDLCEYLLKHNSNESFLVITR